jgi:hypothetical protein
MCEEAQQVNPPDRFSASLFEDVDQPAKTGPTRTRHLIRRIKNLHGFSATGLGEISPFGTLGTLFKKSPKTRKNNTFSLATFCL